MSLLQTDPAAEQLQQRYAVVHFGRRDQYQVAISLAEVGALERLFTDFYTPGWLLTVLERAAPAMAERFRKRYDPALNDRLTTSLVLSYLGIPYLKSLRLEPERAQEVLGELGTSCAARYLDRHPNIGMISYSYHWKALSGIRQSGRWWGPAMVFQVHPVAGQISRILCGDRKKTGLSYSPEAEELQSEENAAEYAASLQHADGILVASEFTAQGLVDAGVPRYKIATVPYGAALARSAKKDVTNRARWRKGYAPLRLLWVGQLAYRKGAHHLFAALCSFSPEQVRLDMVTSSEMPRELRALLPPNVSIFQSVSDLEREEMYQSHHLFVLPSMVEGFGLVYLEALAAGLPILCTRNTGAVDLIRNGVEGFVVESGQSEPIATCIETCLREPELLPRMSIAARETALEWTWPRFRQNVRRHIAEFEHRASDGPPRRDPRLV